MLSAEAGNGAVIWEMGLSWMGERGRGFVQQVGISGGYLVCHMDLTKSYT